MRLELLLWLAALAPQLCGQMLADSAFGDAFAGRRARPYHVMFAGGPAIQMHDADLDVGFWRAQSKATIPIHMSSSLRVFGSVSAAYTRLDPSRPLVPEHLLQLDANTTFMIPVNDVVENVTLLLGGGLKYEVGPVSWDSLDLRFSAAATFKVGERWKLTTGLFFRTGLVDPDFFIPRYLPIPIVYGTYQAGEDLKVEFGFPNNSVFWRPVPEFEFQVGIPRSSIKFAPADWFVLEASYSIPRNGQAMLTHKLADWCTLREFIGHAFEIYQLTDERWPDKSEFQIERWSTGAQAEFGASFGDDPKKPLEFAVLLTWQMGIWTRHRTYSFKDDETINAYHARFDQTAAIAIALRF